MWTPQLAALAARFRVVAPDYRGMGQSRPSPEATTMELAAGDALALLRQLGLRRVAVAGLSMGGYVALELYRRAPEIFRALALCATKVTPDTEEAKATREAFAVNAVAKGLSWVADDTPSSPRGSCLDGRARAAARPVSTTSCALSRLRNARGVRSRPGRCETAITPGSACSATWARLGCDRGESMTYGAPAQACCRTTAPCAQSWTRSCTAPQRTRSASTPLCTGERSAPRWRSSSFRGAPEGPFERSPPVHTVWTASGLMWTRRLASVS
jgi:pimeloyl-ACP methyl ester carboxylesterase